MSCGAYVTYRRGNTTFLDVLLVDENGDRFEDLEPELVIYAPGTEDPIEGVTFPIIGSELLDDENYNYRFQLAYDLPLEANETYEARVTAVDPNDTTKRLNDPVYITGAK